MQDQTNNFERAIGRLEGKIDMVITTMQELSQSFSNLEKGRLSNLEINFAKLLTEVNERQNTGVQKARIVAMWVSLVSGGIISVIGAVVLKYVFKI